MKKSLLVTACLSLLVATTTQVQSAVYRMPATGHGYAMPQQGPSARGYQPQRVPTEIEEAGIVLKAGLEKLLGFFKGQQVPSRAQIAEFLDNEIAPYFDFAYMAKWASGSNVSRMPEQQQKAMVTELKTQFLSTMAQKLSGFDRQTVRYLKPRVSGRNQVELSIAIGNPGTYPARLDFRMYKSKSGWKVYDVSANGSSALVYYRQYFRQKMQAQRSMPPMRYRR